MTPNQITISSDALLSVNRTVRALAEAADGSKLKRLTALLIADTELGSASEDMLDTLAQMAGVELEDDPELQPEAAPVVPDMAVMSRLDVLEKQLQGLALSLPAATAAVAGFAQDASALMSRMEEFRRVAAEERDASRRLALDILKRLDRPDDGRALDVLERVRGLVEALWSHDADGTRIDAGDGIGVSQNQIGLILAGLKILAPDIYTALGRPMPNTRPA